MLAYEFFLCRSVLPPTRLLGTEELNVELWQDPHFDVLSAFSLFYDHPTDLHKSTSVDSSRPGGAEYLFTRPAGTMASLDT